MLNPLCSIVEALHLFAKRFAAASRREGPGEGKFLFMSLDTTLLPRACDTRVASFDVLIVIGLVIVLSAFSLPTSLAFSYLWPKV